MLRIGLIRERKKLADYRVALTPRQCAGIKERFPGVDVVVAPSPNRCFSDAEYTAERIELRADLSDCDILLGIKEVPVENLIESKTYFFFSHTKKKQPYNQGLMHALISKKITMVDYECLTHSDDQRILGFGFYAGIVGAHNGLLTYGRKTGAFELPTAYSVNNFQNLIASYASIKLPPVKIAVTGSGKVAAGVLEVLTQLDIDSVEPMDFLTHDYEYPVFTHLRGQSLYARKDNNLFHRDDFHANPEAYKCLFSSFVSQTDILMNGVYWESRIARLFEKEAIKRHDWRISVISDITCDLDGSVPLNLGSSTIADPVYGIDRFTLEKTGPYIPGNDTIDIMAVDNLPNELPRDASNYFGIHFEKYILPELLKPESEILKRATICENGLLTKKYEYLEDYAYPNFNH